MDVIGGISPHDGRGQRPRGECACLQFSDCGSVIVSGRFRQASLTGRGCYASVQPARELERCEVLDRVENGHGGDNELPFG